jgi:hypothetical protein
MTDATPETLLSDPGLTPGTLADRVAGLQAEALLDLRAYEEQHGHRAFVLALLDKLLPHDAAPDAGGVPDGQPQLSPDSQASPAAPPPHGVPFQPAQPKGDRPA